MDGEELLREAYHLERSGDLDEAVALYDEVATRFPALSAFAADSARRLRARTEAEQEMPPHVVEAWRRVALGLRLVGVGLLASAGSSAWSAIALLSGPGGAVGLYFAVLFAIAAVGGLVIRGLLCCAVPAGSGAKGLMIGAVACAVLAAMLVVGQAVSQPTERGKGSVPAAWAGVALSVAVPVLFATFLRAVADHFRLSSGGAVAFVVAQLVFVGVVLAIGLTRPGGKSGQEAALGLAVVVIVGNVLLTLWLLLIVFQVRSGILSALGPIPTDPQSPVASVGDPPGGATGAVSTQRRADSSEGASECLGCGEEIPEWSDRCLACGWSYETAADGVNDAEEEPLAVSEPAIIDAPGKQPVKETVGPALRKVEVNRCRHCRRVDDDLQRRGYCLHCKQDA